jgi:hypothetical protein
VQTFYKLFGLSTLTTSGDGPRQADFGKVLQEFARAGEDADGFILRVKYFAWLFSRRLMTAGFVE